MKDETIKPVILYASYVVGFVFAESFNSSPNYQEALIVAMVSGIIVVLLAWWLKILK